MIDSDSPLSSESDYLIFIDSDCVPHSKKFFVEEHLNERENSTALTGRRVNLSQNISNKLTELSIKNGSLENQYLKIIDEWAIRKNLMMLKKVFILRINF